jgi:general secretion pathway protein G
MRLAPPGANPRRAAFTLLELLAVIAIIGVLAAVVLGAGKRAVDSGKTARAKAELATLNGALESYRRIHGDYPQTDDGAQLLRALLGQRGPNSATPITARPVIESSRFTEHGGALVDPWGRPFVYVYKTPAAGWSNSGFVLYSVGPDGSDFSRLTTGGFPDATPEANTDNIHANR